MRDDKDKETGSLLAQSVAERQARYTERMREKGVRQRKFWLTDEEHTALKNYLQEMRAAQAGECDPDRA